MANSLLDFVMSLVRDPDAAAAYAANPAQAIADAHLTDVTSVDVNNLIPVVTESMPPAAPSSAMPYGGWSLGADAVGDSALNVWASGAATAAFDAFDDHLPLQAGDVVAHHVSIAANVIDLPVDAAPTIDEHVIDDGGVPSIAAGMEVAPFDQAVVTDAPTLDDDHVSDTAAVDDGHHTGDVHLEPLQDSNVDIFT